MNITPAEYLADPGWQYLREPDDVRMANQSKPYDSKKDIWVPDKEEGYLAGQIEAVKGDEVTVVSSKGTKSTIKKDLIQEMNPPKFDKAEDMSNLSFLNDASVLGNLRARYGAMLIYTYSGLFCVVINPYKRLPIYTDSVAKMYIGKRKNEMPPHLWANSDEAYRNMIQDRENQSMLITGESGAGKTENTKKVIAYFAAVGTSQGGGKPAAEGEKKVSLEDQIVQTNPILEAFGNAKTVRNNNSSRFGKFIRIHFSNAGKVAGCDIEHYLLEKSRVVRQAPGERCYHVFYFMYTNAELKKKLLLDQEIRYYHFVSQAELTVPGIDDTEEFQLMDEAFDILLFSAEEKFDCYRIMSAIMHMGEMKFKDQKEQAMEDGTEEAEKACAMYGIDHKAFLDSLCKPRVKVGTEWVTKGQTCEQVAWGIGAMSKGIYAKVFHWLVTKCNITLDAKEHPRAHFIGVLDIAGFEIFDMNSFEQLWINFVNEKLQQFFNHHMFVLEQEEYQREGIQWTFIDFGLDLAACIELIEKPMGIISMLDEECIVPKATDMTLASKLCDQHLGKHPSFEKPKPPKGKQSEAHFAMKHYAGLVRYNVLNWLEKNKDPLNDTTVAVMKGKTDNALLTHLWSDYMTQEEQAAAAKAGGGGKKKGKSGSMMTVSMMYRESLNKLMTMLHATHPHFVRCLIPNEQKKSGLIEAGLVMNQLTCNGVLEGIRICRKGFPNRIQHADFKVRYSILAPEQAKSSEDLKEAVEAVMKRLCKQGDLETEEFRVGHTKVFFKAGILAKMEDLRDAKLGSCILGVQCFIRSFLGLVDGGHKMKAYKSFGVLQNNIRSWCTLRTWDWYLIYGKVRPLLGKAQEEIDKMEARIGEVEQLLKDEETHRAKAEAEAARLGEIGQHIEDELQKRRENEHHAADMVAKVKREADVAEQGVNDLKSSVESMEAQNSEFNSFMSSAGAECAEMKSQCAELEKKIEAETAEKGARDEALAKLTEEKAAGEDESSRLGRDTRELATANARLKDEMEQAEDRAAKLARDMKTYERKAADIEDVMGREGRAKGDTEASNKHLEDQLRSALDKIDALTEQVTEADHTTKAKERDVSLAQERLRDQASKVLRLEQQLIELGSQVTQLGRPAARY